MEKKKVLILCGGRSSEHRISLISGSGVIQNIDRDTYDVHVVAIDIDGTWYYQGDTLSLSHPDSAQDVALLDKSTRVILSQNPDDRRLYMQEDFSPITTIDTIFPVLHGTYGEDGSIQGLAKIAGIPCVGCSILGSAATMDKDITKRLLRDTGIGVAPFVTLRKGYNDTLSYSELSEKLGSTLFIKPVNLGSSVGVSCVKNEEEYLNAIELGFSYDDKLLVESLVVGREIECAVKGNTHIQASVIGEIVPKSGVYTFESKYVDDDGAALLIPADLDADQMERAKNLAIETFRVLECKGLSRVDMFLTENNELIVNEVNSIPGFTKISMYPKLWAYEGVSYSDLITELIELAH